jgi:hypothetical protein
LENCSYSEDVDRGWQNLKGKSGTSATASVGQCELQQHKPCFIENFYVIFIKGTRLKYYSYRIQNKRSLDNLNISRLLETKRRTYLVKDKNVDLVTDSYVYWLGGGSISLR